MKLGLYVINKNKPDTLLRQILGSFQAQMLFEGSIINDDSGNGTVI
jgi:hypothetical protein